MQKMFGLPVALALAVLTTIPLVSAQSQYSSTPGFFVSGDVFGSQNRFTFEDKAYGFSFGMRVGEADVRSFDFALRVERNRGWLPDRGPAIPGATFYGVEAGATLQRTARSVTRAAVTGGTLVADNGGVEYPADGGFRFTRGRTTSGAMIHLNAVRNVRFGDCFFYVMPGLGVYGEAERRFDRTVVYNADSENENRVVHEGNTQLSGGLLLLLPLVFEPRSDRQLIVEPMLKVDIPELLFSFGVLPYLNVRLNF
ncbi:hypothetical protein BH23BAC4_BH23BAC4_17410 [soil metagenome]